MTLGEVLEGLGNLGAGLVVADGRLRYVGPRLATDHPIRTAITEHRAQLVDLFTFRPARSASWSERLGRQVYEPVPERPGCWRETPASAALCIWCAAPLADGDKLACPEHRREMDAGPTARHGLRVSEAA